MRAGIGALATLALCAGVAAGSTTAASAGDTATTSAKPVHKAVKVADNFYSPKRFSVPRNSTIVWKWSRLNADSHDVYLEKKPRGVKRFQSPPAATFFSYKRKLKKAGVYRIICTFHENMSMRIKVKP